MTIPFVDAISGSRHGAAAEGPLTQPVERPVPAELADLLTALPGADGPPRVEAVHHRVFMVFQPWWGCAYCLEERYMQEEGEGEGPPDGEAGGRRKKRRKLNPDVEPETPCPHTEREAYERLLSLFGSKPTEYSIQGLEEKILDSGVTLVSLKWITFAAAKREPAGIPRL